MTEKQIEQLKASVELLKEAFDKLGKNELVMQDLRAFCELVVPTDMSGKTPNTDLNKVMIMAGRASVFQRIDYWVNTPVEQIVKDKLNNFGA
nr:MAG TPA: hypothetical protein [Bacteriophage sp.]